jgi:hypothetical protein
LIHTAIFMVTKDSVLRSVLLLVCLLAPRLDAQVVETPIAFDSAGKIRSITPALVERFQLTAPVWPVTGEFVEARLFALSGGGSVIVAQQRSGALTRYPLTDDERGALRSAVDRAMTRSGAVVSEEAPQTLSQPARGAFIRDQMILAGVLYGPLLASLANDGRTATAVYLLSVAGSYFALSSLPKTLVVTRAQNDLAGDGALRGYFLTGGILTAVAGSDIDYKVYNGVGLLGSIGMSVIGFNRGRRMTDSEAKATTTISTLSGFGALGVLGSLGGVHDGQERVVAATMTAAGIAGYIAGPLYPRRAPYTVTSGDVATLFIGATLGAAAGFTPFIDRDGDVKPAYALTTAGGALGTFLADRLLVRPFDYGSSDVTQLALGTIAGGLVGGALTVMLQPDATAAMGLVTGGAIVGAIAGHHLADPPRARPRTGSIELSPSHLGTARWQLNPAAVALTSARVPGQHALLSFTF